MEPREIHAELVRLGLTGLDIAQAVGCHETVPTKVIRSGWVGGEGTLQHRCAEEIARVIGRPFDEVWDRARGSVSRGVQTRARLRT